MIVAETSGHAHSIGWLTSLCLHGTLAFGALVVTQRMTLAPQPIPFTWNVAMVAALPEPPKTPSTPSTTTHSSLVKVPPPPSLASASAAPSGGTGLNRTMTVEPAREASEPVARKDEAPRVLDSPSRMEDTKPQKEEEQVVTPAQAAAPAPQLSSLQPETAPELSPTTEQVLQGQETGLPGPAPNPTVTSALRPDYAWLSEAIMRRMQELKRYPAEARLDRAEGKVVLKAVIRSNGSLEAVEIFQSSGHQILDRAALDLLTEAAPFQFPRPLEKPQMTVKIPMSYRLEP